MKRLSAMSCLLLLALVPARGAGEAGGVAEPGPEVRADPPPEAVRDHRGWLSRGTPPDPAALLASAEPQAVPFPEAWSQRLQRRTVVFYLSPSCSHCVVAEAELAALSLRVKDIVDFLAVVSGNASAGAFDTLVASQVLPFPLVHDVDHAFADALGLTSTPSLLVLDPPAAPGGPVPVREAWLPYIHGADAILEVRLRGEAAPVLARGDWLGTITCSSCHAEESRSWSLTAHSVAWYRAALAGAVERRDCLGCHVTNLLPPGEEVGGFRVGDLRSPFGDVGCEACHGPSGPHDGEPADPRSACAACHADRGDFRFDEALALIDHHAAGQVSDAALQGQRLALATGMAERPMAALREGETAEARACASCHRRQYRKWKASPHAAAMGSLAEEEQGEATCLACHATPFTLGVAVDGSHFRPGEGVGCGSCHGPVAAHAADPGQPVRSLREPDPECAVDHVCRGCHTEQWSPGWDVREALPHVRH